MSKTTYVSTEPRVPTKEEAEAILLLVKTGWLKLELTLNDESA